MRNSRWGSTQHAPRTRDRIPGQVHPDEFEHTYGIESVSRAKVNQTDPVRDSGPRTVRIVRRGHPLDGQEAQVQSGKRDGEGRLQLWIELADGKRLGVPSGWTDWEGVADGQAGTFGGLGDYHALQQLLEVLEQAHGGTGSGAMAAVGAAGGGGAAGAVGQPAAGGAGGAGGGTGAADGADRGRGGRG